VVFERKRMGLELFEAGFFEQERIKKERVRKKNNRDLIFFINSYLPSGIGRPVPPFNYNCLRGSMVALCERKSPVSGGYL
jgi:hypothetical protein